MFRHIRVNQKISNSPGMLCLLSLLQQYLLPLLQLLKYNFRRPAKNFRTKNEIEIYMIQSNQSKNQKIIVQI